jgi:tight adherence protein C
MPGTLAEEFRVALREMELGTPRREAFEALRRRNDVEPLSQFVTAIQQAEELGAPLSQALVEISTDMRRTDAQYMRRKAQRLNPRITVITGATLLPAVLILVAGALFIGSGVDFGAILGS